jgi:diguanylate cyclase (GGDEF)-like protein/PAS domain S-box-containing protein
MSVLSRNAPARAAAVPAINSAITPAINPGLVDPERKLGIDAERVALKDDHLAYRACSMAFAQAIGVPSPEHVIGKTDFDLFPGDVAREQMSLDSRTIYTREPDIGSIDLGDGQQAMIMRAPVFARDGSVRGVDLRLLGGPTIPAMQSALSVDFETLVSEGLQGSLVMSGREILFANTRAAELFGFSNPSMLVDHGQVGDLFDEGERARIAEHAARSLDVTGSIDKGEMAVAAQGRDGAQLRLLGRVLLVQWGNRRATLFSFVDVSRLLKRQAPNQAPRAILAAPVSSDVPTLARRVTPVVRDDELAQEMAELRATARRFKHYASAAADFFWETDDALAFRRVSPDFARVLGVPIEHLTGRTHRQLTEHPSNAEDESSWREQLERLAAHEPFSDVEFRWNVNGDARVIRYSGVPVTENERFIGYRGVGRDVTAATRQAEATAYHANHDALTGLANRRHFETVVGDALAAASHERRTHALCYMDLDNFKPVNDTCGHQAGDELLRQLSRLFDDLVRKSDVLARLGGDEFGVFLFDCEVPQALKLANQIRSEVEGFQFLWEETAFQVGVSIGLVVVDDRWESTDSLFSAADAACYIAKNEGRNRVSVYREGEGNASNRQVATHWVEEIESALADNRIQVAAQKIVPLHRQPDGIRYEMLMRLKMPDGSYATPRSFLPSADRYGLSSALDERVFDLTLAWLEGNPQILHDARTVSLNLASGTFTQSEAADRLLERINTSTVPAEKLCFELTETAAIANLSKASEFMERLAAIGCSFSIDDFGSGLSSFAWLRKLPVDFLKIDGLLVKDMLDDPIDLTLVRAISDISKSMGKRTIAEFVESPRLLNAVRDAGIDFAQGYYIGEPELIRID